MPKPLAIALGLALTLFTNHSAAQEPPSAQAVASRAPEGMTVRYSLTEPTLRVVFADRDTIRDRWTVITAGLTLVDGSITAAQPFDAFELSLLPDAAEVDRVYMGLSLAGEGRVLYGPGLMLEGLRTSLAFETAPGETSRPAADAIHGYAWSGPAADLAAADGRGDLVAGDNVAPELKTVLGEALFASMAFYQNKLNAPLPFHPVLIGSVDSPGPAGFRGDVTNTGVIFVRFQGDVWRQAIEAVVPFIWHETFHLWNGHGVESRDGDDAPWLHEGGADYAAVLGAVSTGAMSEADARSRIADRLNGCRRVLGHRDLDPARLRSGSGPYDCGVVIQWLADLEARRAGSGDVFTLWRSLLASARGSATGYGVSDFRALVGPASAVAILLDGPGATRWDTITARLSDLGVTLENRPGDHQLRGAALMHLAEINCNSGSYGFYDIPGALKLDGADCGVLSGEPIIDTVEGHDPQGASRAMFDAVQARCDAALPVRYATRDGRLLEAMCDRPLAEPEVWAIAAAPRFAVSVETSRPL